MLCHKQGVFLAALLLTEHSGGCCITPSFLSVPGHQIFRLGEANVSHADATVRLRPGFLMVLLTSSRVWNVNQLCFNDGALLLQKQLKVVVEREKQSRLDADVGARNACWNTVCYIWGFCLHRLSQSRWLLAGGAAQQGALPVCVSVGT